MSKILFLVDKYYPKPFANSVCAQNIIDSLIKKGNEVDVLAYSDFETPVLDSFHGCKIYHVNPDIRLRLFYYVFSKGKKGVRSKIAFLIAKAFSLLEGLLFFRCYPRYSLFSYIRIRKKVIELQKNNRYDGIVSMLSPVDTNLALASLKKKRLLSVPWIIYNVDYLNRYSGKKSKRNTPLYIYFLEYSDYFVTMEANSHLLEGHAYDGFRHKIITTGLPMLKEVEADEMIEGSFNEWDERSENWSYFGSIGGVHYKVKDLLDFFFNLPNDKKRTLYFFTRGFDVDLKGYPNTANKKIVIGPYLSQREMHYYQNKSDFLVSLKYSSLISAKNFEYMNCHKIIVHFSGHKDDPTKKEVLLYPKGIVVDATQGDASCWVSSFFEQLERARKSSLTAEELSKLFLKNTPDYNASIIIDLLGKSKRKE